MKRNRQQGDQPKQRPARTWIDRKTVRDIGVAIVRGLTAILLEWLRQGGRL